MKVKIHSSWQKYLQSEFDKPYFEQLTSFVRQEYATQTVYPPGKLIFNENITVGKLIGIGLIVVGIVLFSYSGKSVADER